MKKILICGDKSFVARGLDAKLAESELSFDCFSRGDCKRGGNRIFGDVMNMSQNELLDDYHTVVNFIIIKDGSIDDNIRYIQSLLDFCISKGVKRLIHISSISVYPNQAKYVNEDSEIEENPQNKGGYASVKVAVDHYLELNKPESLEIIYVRPGYIYDVNADVSRSGLFIPTPICNVLLGDKRTSLPIIDKRKLHNAIIKIIAKEDNNKVYLLLNKDKEASYKYDFVKHQWGGRILNLPGFMILPIAKLLHKLHVLNNKLYLKIVGLFKRTWFDSTKSEETLSVNLGKDVFCVIGSGAYGSYTTNLLSEKFPHDKVVIIEVGDNKLKNESQIGYLSNITNAPYNALKKGRFFGYGGATVKWGGQLFTFSENDFDDSVSQFTKDIVDRNIKYRQKVLSRFGLVNNFEEHNLQGNMFIKSGIWLSYFQRNLFKFFGILKKNNVSIINNTRVVKLNIDSNGKVDNVECISNGEKKRLSFDRYFLAAGAFESSRILIASGLASDSKILPFSDHLSQKVFKIKSGTLINGDDLCFDIKGASLVTRRFVGEVDGVSYFCHPIFNQDFPFFQNLKTLLFGRKISINLLFNIFKDIPSCLAFAWSVLIKKKMYVYNNEYYLQIDIENSVDSGCLSLSNVKDQYNENGLDIDFNIDGRTEDLFLKAKTIIKEYLDRNSVVYEEVVEETQVEKYEDTYHPFGSYCDFASIDDFYNRNSNLLVLNTAILQRAGGINSTCAVMPLIEDYVENIMS